MSFEIVLAIASIVLYIVGIVSRWFYGRSGELWLANIMLGCEIAALCLFIIFFIETFAESLPIPLIQSKTQGGR